MGFGFRRSIKLFPGVRANLSLGGASLSVGGRGVTTNLSARGVRSTFSVPGSGLSWTSSSGGGGSRSRRSGYRAPSARQLAAANRRAEVEERRAAAQAEIDEEEAALGDVVNRWRDAPSVPRMQDYEVGLLMKPFEWTAVPPQPPGAEVEWSALLVETRSMVAAEGFATGHVASVALGIVAAVVIGGGGSVLAAATGLVGLGMGSLLLAIVVGVAITVIGGALTQARKIAAADLQATERAKADWPARWSKDQVRHRDRLGAWEADRDQQRASWDGRERERTTWAKRLVAGDVAALSETIEESLADLDFPFETECKVEVPTAGEVYLLVDLPEIEDVIPETKKRVLKDGRTKESKRTRQEQCEEYAHLACGLALLLGRTVFEAGPTVRVVHVAGYTQRRQRRSGEVGDDFVFEVRLDRDRAAALDMDALDPVELLGALASRISLKANGDLGKIPAPDWAEA